MQVDGLAGAGRFGDRVVRIERNRSADTRELFGQSRERGKLDDPARVVPQCQAAGPGAKAREGDLDQDVRDVRWARRPRKRGRYPLESDGLLARVAVALLELAPIAQIDHERDPADRVTLDDRGPEQHRHTRAVGPDVLLLERCDDAALMQLRDRGGARGDLIGGVRSSHAILPAARSSCVRPTSSRKRSFARTMRSDVDSSTPMMPASSSARKAESSDSQRAPATAPLTSSIAT